MSESTPAALEAFLQSSPVRNAVHAAAPVPIPRQTQLEPPGRTGSGAGSLLSRALRLLPIGAINGRYLRIPPKVDDPRLGRSLGLPFAMRFLIDEGATGFPGGIGRIAHRAWFSDSPGFSVHIVYAGHRPDLLGRSNFANPGSHWYNVFIGYYQVEVDEAEWGRPFAYDLDSEGQATLRLEELARLVKADWNHLSNQLYGVPASAIGPINALGLDNLRSEHEGRTSKPGWDGAWDVAEFKNLRVVGSHSAHRGRDYVDLDAITGRLWRRSFGTFREPVDAESFEACLLRMRAYISCQRALNAEGRPVYRTYVFGGSINHRYDKIDAAENCRFLELQMLSLEGIIRQERGIGFLPGAKLSGSSL